MQVTASFGDESVAVLLDVNCRTLSAFRQALQAALPLLDVEKMCVHLGQRLLDDESVAALRDGSVVTLSATLAARAADTLREEGCAVDTAGFVQALEAGDVRLCGLYLDAEVSYAPPSAPLSVAAGEGHLELCRLLLDRGCEQDSSDPRAVAPLLCASVSGHLEVCKLLLDRGCAKEAKHANGMTALHF
eukprot:Rhum_TRINITY_DN14954_c0_g1::Rhum_TRINITY_DN14954_c0_g1_i2::g.127119::m.127119